MENAKVQGRSFMEPCASNTRPQSEDHAPKEHHVTSDKSSPDYILITQELLNEFKTEVARSSKVTLKFSSINYRQHHESSCKTKLPPLFADRLQMLHEKAGNSIDFSRSFRGRPVKVIVDDITQMCSARGTQQHERAKTISCNHGSKRASISRKSRDVADHRGLESGDEGEPVGFKGGEDAIESVAKANSIPAEPSGHQVLPQIRAAPCPIHVKQEKGKGQDILYSTTSHARDPRDVKTFKQRFQPHPIKSISIQQRNDVSTSQEALKGNRIGISVKVPGQYPVKQPALPKNMSSKDYVVSWLIHGSAPPGSNHFPEIVPQGGQGTSRSKLGRKHAGTSE